VGVAASTPERSRLAARELDVDADFDTVEALVQDARVDVVHICTPNSDHAELTRLAISAGKHVVCEKPLATSHVEAVALANAVEKAGLVGAVPFVYRFHPMVREARSRTLGGELGPVRVIHGSYLQDWMVGEETGNWRVAQDRGGPSRAFADIGSHWCDLAEWVSGERISAVVASTKATVSHRPTTDASTFAASGLGEMTEVETEDVACLLLQTSSGALGSVTVSQVSPGRKNRLWLQIDGDRSSIVFDQEQPERLWIGARSSTTVLVRDPATLSEEAASYAVLPAGHAQGYQDCFDAFVRDVYSSIRTGGNIAGLPTFADGARAAALTEAVLTSADKREWVEV
jgi:predicted dehydrogenase